MSKKTKIKQQLRIVGGKWKGRKLTFPNNQDLRPTLSRTRETLFNWLRPSILNSSCLDLFAGSGALGFEAMSQGASTLTFVEKDRDAFQNIQKQAVLLEAEITSFHGDAIEFLELTDENFDIAFLDPPYSQPHLIENALSVILKKNLIKHFLYIEVLSLGQLKELETKFFIRLLKSSKNGVGQSTLFDLEPRTI